jgi:hypothetical protein
MGSFLRVRNKVSDRSGGTHDMDRGPIKGRFHADATFSVSTLNYRISGTCGNINVGG